MKVGLLRLPTGILGQNDYANFTFSKVSHKLALWKKQHAPVILAPAPQILTVVAPAGKKTNNYFDLVQLSIKSTLFPRP